MKVQAVDFLEPVHSPAKKGEMVDRFRATEAGPLRCRMLGPGLVLEADGKTLVTLIPWGNVRCAVTEFEDSDVKAAKR